ncbi:DHA2 family efflux MFS transporter permease subunit [Lichenihabitans sp. PAMC28606]|uniref:DHA2 family efflux MFS transporter permease subunit n=1 Tax=Lichenihabitans sp. PAMC28606 TaxID=2880932 RepID=UPI001D0BA689|nr:DHA2 family efflux MFS transporter permease subunit [Lichenihabitans sp. PAMC28606]UDL94425.1 DHA2 family efflux MFS transporter permease subunit [Lichenihabitans sp. PAMC28606]
MAKIGCVQTSLRVERVGAATWIGFAAMSAGMFMAILDVQIVAAALPTMQAGLGIAPSAMSWIQTAYLSAEVVAIPLTGALTGILGMRWLFVVAVALFTLASLGCAASHGFIGLIVFRVIQGFAGGTLIPAVFAAVFLLFPTRHQGLATTLAGVMAVLAPTVGPVVGGWITATTSWHWLFLINLAPGLLAALGGAAFLPKARPDLRGLRALDGPSILLLGAGLASFEIGLKGAPSDGWTSAWVLGTLSASVIAVAVFLRRTSSVEHPLVDLRPLKDRSFAIGCGLSFILGMGLFGSTYLMPVFLALVRGHDPLEVGRIMLVTGVAQLLTAPLAVFLERRVDGRILAAIGFTLFGAGMALGAAQNAFSDYDALFWPQVLRGAAIMFCLLPPTRFALGHLPPERVPGASGLFNLMRNLGGAIGLALIDSVIYGRVGSYASTIEAGLRAGDVGVAKAVGIPLPTFMHHADRLDPATQALLARMVERSALTQAIDDAWAIVAILTVLALVALAFVRKPRRDPAQDVVDQVAYVGSADA